jgi:hypothetical protein
MRIVAGIAASVAMILAGGAARAQEGVLGLAAAQAAEAGTGICFDTNASRAMQCAVDACAAESGLPAEYCEPQRWCAPAQWSADLFVQSSSGPHWHEYLCGWSSLEQLHQAIRVKCATPGLIACSAVRTWTPAGEEVFAEN